MLQFGCCRAVMGKHFISSETPSLCQAPTNMPLRWNFTDLFTAEINGQKILLLQI